MTYRVLASLATVLVFVGCTANGVSDDPRQAMSKSEFAAPDEPRKTVLMLKAGADCPGTVLDETNGVLCLFTYPIVDPGSQQTIVALESGADCPGVKFQQTKNVLCLVQHPRGWQPLVYGGLLYYKIPLAGS